MWGNWLFICIVLLCCILFHHKCMTIFHFRLLTYLPVLDLELDVMFCHYKLWSTLIFKSDHFSCSEISWNPSNFHRQCPPLFSCMQLLQQSQILCASCASMESIHGSSVCSQKTLRRTKSQILCASRASMGSIHGSSVCSRKTLRRTKSQILCASCASMGNIHGSSVCSWKTLRWTKLICWIFYELFTKFLRSKHQSLPS